MATNVKYIIIEKNGDCTCKQMKNNDNIVEELYKKCGFKKSDGFNEVCKWELDSGLLIHVYGRAHGLAGSENKFDFPPPIDNTLFFGNMAVIASINGEYVDLDDTHWGEIYSELMGGFEELGEEDSDEECSEDEIAIEDQTKHGYLKDDFVVDDDDCEDVTNDEDEDEDDENTGDEDYSEEELSEEQYVSESE